MSGGTCNSAAACLTGMLGRTSCRIAKTNTPAMINLPIVLIQLSICRFMSVPDPRRRSKAGTLIWDL